MSGHGNQDADYLNGRHKEPIMTEQSDKPSVDGLTLAALTKAERALWVLREHNHLHFGHGHSTVADAQAAWILVRERLAALAGPLEQPQEPDSSYSTSRVGQINKTALPEVPPAISAISERLHTQDNRITSHPLFAVQQKRIVYGLDEDYASEHRWVDYDGECSQEDAAVYDAKRENGDPLPDGVRRLGLVEHWEFVAGCFTEQGCKDFIACNGHNLKEPRIYAYSAYRNAEFIAMREWLMSLRAGVEPIAGPSSEPLSQNKPAASSAPESSVSVPKEQQAAEILRDLVTVADDAYNRTTQSVVLAVVRLGERARALTSGEQQ